VRRPEQALQIAVAAYMGAIPDLLFFHIPNGGGRSKIEAAIFKRMGVKPGVPDLAVILPGGRVGFIELKAGKGRASPAQRAFADALVERGCPCVEARSLEDVAEALSRWLTPFGYRIPRLVTKAPSHEEAA
jgi:hypothetical protein